MRSGDSAAHRDTQRSAVYSAEDQWTAILDRGGVVDFFGSTLTLVPQRRFGDMDAVRAYVEQVCATNGITTPEVRSHAGHSRAHYSSTTSTIAIPWNVSARATGWAARESVLLHEIAHHWAFVSDASLLHDFHYVRSMIRLVTSTLGDEAALLLRAGYDGAGVRG